jgi:alcohol dehydrogenase class IV
MEPMDAALAGLASMENWMKEVGVVLHASELGVTEAMIAEIAAVTPLYDTGYRKLTKEDVEEILRESL